MQKYVSFIFIPIFSLLIFNYCDDEKDKTWTWYHAIFEVDGVKKDYIGGYYKFEPEEGLLFDRWDASWYIDDKQDDEVNNFHTTLPDGTTAESVFDQNSDSRGFQVQYVDSAGKRFEVQSTDIFTMTMSKWGEKVGGAFAGTLKNKDDLSTVTITNGTFEGIIE
jgi:hypothetical protein